MKNLLLAATAILALTATTPALAADGAAPANAAKHDQMKGHERHPAIRKAQHALEVAADALEHADKDFGGHRAKAMELIKQAQAELKAALEYDEHHDKK